MKIRAVVALAHAVDPDDVGWLSSGRGHPCTALSLRLERLGSLVCLELQRPDGAVADAEAEAEGELGDFTVVGTRRRNRSIP
jgi:hypothetical protein